jgi:hypothetical protein
MQNVKLVSLQKVGELQKSYIQFDALFSIQEGKFECLSSGIALSLLT